MSERPSPPQVVVSPDQRRQILTQAVQAELARGARIESQHEFGVVVVRGRKVRHVLHLIVTVLTGGSWGLVWLGLAIFGGLKRTAVSVDELGQVLRRKA
jgi:hypothetical protein